MRGLKTFGTADQKQRFKAMLAIELAKEFRVLDGLDEQEAHAAERRRGGGHAPAFLALHPVHHRDHSLSEQDQREQTEAFGQVRAVWRGAQRMSQCDPRRDPYGPRGTIPSGRR